MENFNKKFTETSLRIGEVRFSYVNVFSPGRTRTARRASTPCSC